MFEWLKTYVDDYEAKHYNDDGVEWADNSLQELLMYIICKFKHREDGIYKALKERHPEDDKVLLAIVEMEKICPKCDCQNEIETLTLVAANDYQSDTLADL